MAHRVLSATGLADGLDRTFTLMDFTQAIDVIRRGGAITRVSWNDESVNVALRDGLVTIHLADGTDRGWLMSEADVYARDWQTVTHG